MCHSDANFIPDNVLGSCLCAGTSQGFRLMDNPGLSPHKNAPAQTIDTPELPTRMKTSTVRNLKFAENIMAISNIHSSQQPPSVNSLTPSKPVSSSDNAKTNAEKFAATIVTLSAQARKLNLSDNAPVQNPNRVDTAVSATAHASAPQTAKPGAASPQETPSRSPINTYA